MTRSIAAALVAAAAMVQQEAVFANAACTAADFPDAAAWFEYIADHVTAVDELETTEAKREKVFEVLPSLEEKICENKDAIEALADNGVGIAVCDAITMQAYLVLQVDPSCMCGGECPVYLDYVVESQQLALSGGDTQAALLDPSAAACGMAKCYASGVCTVPAMLGGVPAPFTALSNSAKCQAAAASDTDDANSLKRSVAPILTAIVATSMAAALS